MDKAYLAMNGVTFSKNELLLQISRKASPTHDIIKLFDVMFLMDVATALPGKKISFAMFR